MHLTVCFVRNMFNGVRNNTNNIFILLLLLTPQADKRSQTGVSPMSPPTFTVYLYSVLSLNCSLIVFIMAIIIISLVLLVSLVPNLTFTGKTPTHDLEIYK